jgi:hypothetical protein
VLLQEPNGTSREIDILIESSVAGHKIRIAIECRQHNRKEDLIWIDQLIGKFTNLRSEVQKIVAVSASGFSSSAIKKANQNGIETKTFRELEDVDWPSEFRKLGIGITRFEFEILSFQLETSPPYPDTLFRRSQIIDADAQSVGDIESVVKFVYAERVNSGLREFMNWYLSQCKTVSDLEKNVKVSLRVPVENLWIPALSGVPSKLVSIIYELVGKATFKKMPIQHLLYTDNVQVSLASFQIKDRKVSLSISQVAGRAEGQVTIDAPIELKFPRKAKKRKG